MNLETLIETMRATCFGTLDVVVIQTHISVVFLAGNRAYKLKKPLDLGFLDYSTPELRRTFCEEEVRLNQRLAPGVYLGVRSVVPAAGEGLGLSEPDDPAAIDWVVEMRRLDDSDTFLSHLHAGTLEPSWLGELGRMMASFHARCEPGVVGRFGAFETVARNARENFSQSEEQVGVTVSAAVFERAREANAELLEQLEPLIEERDRTGHTRDTHGDLRLEHVYRVDGDLVVVDCIEFNDAFRFSDPVADIAFLVMDLRIRWGEDLADAFANSYFEARPGGEELLEFYVAYRSAVRAKVHGIAATESERDADARQRSLTKSQAHWLFAWSTLARPSARPALVLVGGLPGTGKSTLARYIAAQHGFEQLDSDEVRKELAGVSADTSMRAAADEGIYSAQWTERTYETLLSRAMTAVTEGGRVAVSATFWDAERRDSFLRAAHRLGVCGLMLQCVLDPVEARRRIASRRGGASDADLATYDHIASAWEPFDDWSAARLVRISTEDLETSHAEVVTALRKFELLAP